MSRTRARDEGLRRVSTITRGVANLGVAGTGLLAAFVYGASPGHTTVSTTTPPGATPSTDPGTSASSAAVPADPASPGFQAPAVAPTPTDQNPVVQSGAS
jgi:hypothetical protein